jgi:hypothetical protein
MEMALMREYLKLLEMCKEDPIMKALSEEDMEWADVPTSEEEEEFVREWRKNEGRIILGAMLTEIRLKNGVKMGYENKKTLILHNIPKDVRNEEIREIFSGYGIIRDIYIPKNMERDSINYGKVRGFAILKYESGDCARRAYEEEKNRVTIRDRIITLEFAKEDRD